MRPLLLSCLFSTLLVTGCAFKGVIVEKQEAPLPFYHSVGTDGSYAFLLRGEGGVVRRQLVTPQVFDRYAVGDYFDDLVPGPTRPSEGKSMVTAMTSAKKDAPKVAQMRKVAPPRRLAASRKRPASKSAVRRIRNSVARHKLTSRKTKVRTVQLAPRIARTKEAEMLFVRVVHCR